MGKRKLEYWSQKEGNREIELEERERERERAVTYTPPTLPTKSIVYIKPSTVA